MDVNVNVTCFDSSDNSNLGLQLRIDRTNSSIRPAQLRIEIQYHPFGQEITPGFFGGVNTERYVGSKQNFEFNTTDEFIDYQNFDQYLHPVNSLSLDFDDWNSKFGETISTPFPQRSIGHYFLIKVLLTDKSGRTIKLRVGGFWAPIPGVDYPNENWIWTEICG